MIEQNTRRNINLTRRYIQFLVCKIGFDFYITFILSLQNIKNLGVFSTPFIFNRILNYIYLDKVLCFYLN